MFCDKKATKQLTFHQENFQAFHRLSMSAAPSSSGALANESAAENYGPSKLIRDYLLEHEPVFARLYNLQQEVRCMTP